MNHRLVAPLRAAGYLVHTVQESRLAGAADAEQLAYATERGCRIVTYDGHNYRRLHVQYRNTGRHHAGIMIVPGASTPARLVMRTRMLLSWTDRDGIANAQLSTWGELVRLFTRGFRVPGYDEADVRLALGLPR